MSQLPPQPQPQSLAKKRFKLVNLDGVKELVSNDRTRYKQGNHNLDLTYITDNVLAMGFPATGLDRLWRNDIADVCAFLKEKHGDNFRIWNLAEKPTNEAEFDHKVKWVPFLDHHPPPLALLCKIVDSIAFWLKSSPKHVAVVHCVGGKGRTGTVISSYLYYSNSPLFPTVDSALEHFASKRSSKALGVTQPSQRRYTKYIQSLILGEPMNIQAIQLCTISIGPLPLEKGYGLEVFDSPLGQSFLNSGGTGGGNAAGEYGRGHESNLLYSNFKVQPDKDGMLHYDIELDVIGDLYIRFTGQTVLLRRTSLFHIALHTYFITNQKMVFKKPDLDNLSSSKTFPVDLGVEITFDKPSSTQKIGILSALYPYLVKYADHRKAGLVSPRTFSVDRHSLTHDDSDVIKFDEIQRKNLNFSKENSSVTGALGHLSFGQNEKIGENKNNFKQNIGDDQKNLKKVEENNQESPKKEQENDDEKKSVKKPTIPGNVNNTGNNNRGSSRNPRKRNSVSSISFSRAKNPQEQGTGSNTQSSSSTPLTSASSSTPSSSSSSPPSSSSNETSGGPGLSRPVAYTQGNLIRPTMPYSPSSSFSPSSPSTRLSRSLSVTFGDIKLPKGGLTSIQKVRLRALSIIKMDQNPSSSSSPSPSPSPSPALSSSLSDQSTANGEEEEAHVEVYRKAKEIATTGLNRNRSRFIGITTGSSTDTSDGKSGNSTGSGRRSRYIHFTPEILAQSSGLERRKIDLYLAAKIVAEQCAEEELKV